MKRNSVLGTAQFLLVLIGIIMIVFGSVVAEQFNLPPILSGFAFLIVAWSFKSLKRKSH